MNKRNASPNRQVASLHAKYNYSRQEVRRSRSVSPGRQVIDELNKRNASPNRQVAGPHAKYNYSRQEVRIRSRSVSPNPQVASIEQSKRVASPNKQVELLPVKFTRKEVRSRSVSPNRQVTSLEVTTSTERQVRMRSVSPQPVRITTTGKSRSEVVVSPKPACASPQRACPSPTFQRLQQDLAQRSVSPGRDKVNMKVVQPSRSTSPIITITNHGIPPWAWAPRRRHRSPSPAALVVVQPDPREKRAQSPSFNELERQMVEKSAFPLGTHQGAQFPTVRQFQRELAASPTVTLAQHRRSPSPSMRSRPTERRIVRLSSPVPFKKEGSPYRHVAPPYATYPAPYVAHVQRVGHTVWMVGFLKITLQTSLEINKI